jgi:MFS family permease
MTAALAAPPRAAGRALWPLYAGQAVAAIGLAAGGTAGPLLAGAITGSPELSPLPLGLLVLGAAGSAPAVTALMRRRGRGTGLAACYGMAGAGVAGALLAAALLSWPLLLAASLLLGVGNTGVMIGRYVAADAAPPGREGRAIGLAMTAVTVGAVGGPALLGPAGPAAAGLGLPREAGLYLLALLAFPLAAWLVRPRDTATAGVRAAAPPRGLRAPAGSGVRLAYLVLGGTNLIMVSVMASAPAWLHLHGWPLDAVGVVVALHVAAMFAPSVLSGRLRDRIGAAGTALAGAAVLVAAAGLGALAAPGAGLAAHVAVLGLLGLGWNLQLIGGTALLVESAAGPLRARAEGRGEAVMGLAAAAGTLGLAGPLLSFGGLAALWVALAAVAMLIAVPLTGHLRAEGRRP